MPKWPKQSGETAPENRLSRVDTTPVNSGLRKAKSFDDWPTFARQEDQQPRHRDNPLVVLGEILLGGVIGLFLVGFGGDSSIPLINEFSEEFSSSFGSDFESTAFYVIMELLEAFIP